MGCVFNHMSLDGHLTKAQVTSAFESEQDQDRYENGHSYSGGFGMATGLIFETGGAYPNHDAAYEYLDQNCQKWGEARAVRYKNDKGVECWMIGANCSS